VFVRYLRLSRLPRYGVEQPTQPIKAEVGRRPSPSRRDEERSRSRWHTRPRK